MWLQSSRHVFRADSGSKRFLATVTREHFWQDLGAPKFISAPMVDQSNLAWRLLVRQNGVDVAFTQMVHSKNFVRDKTYRKNIADWIDYRASNGSLESEKWAESLDRPLIVQLAGDNPDFLAETAKAIEAHGVTAIDLNLGCPQNIAKRGHYGAYLLPERELIVKCLSSMVAATSIPITAKIRKLPDEEETLRLVQAIENCGVSMLTVHGRLVTQNKQFTGQVDWGIIRKIKQTVGIPVVANGGIETLEQAMNCLEETGANAVMSSEGLLQNPKLFSVEGDRLFRENILRSQLSSAKEYLRLLRLYPHPHPLETVVRGHLFKILFRLLSAPKNFDVRQTLATSSFEGMVKAVEDLDLRVKNIDYDMQYAIEHEMVAPLSANWYHRHRRTQGASQQ